MAIIGTFTKTDNGFTGKITTLAIKAQARFDKNEGKQADNHPDYHLLSGGMKIGAAWERTGKKGPYLSVTFDDPGFAPGYYSLSKTGVEHGYTLIFERPKAKKAD